MTLQDALLVAQLLASVAAAVACVFLVLALIRLKSVLTNIEEDIKMVTERAMPVLENIDYISERIKNISDNIDDQVMVVRESVGSLREVVDNVVDLERKIQSRIEGPLLDTVSTAAAVVKGVKTFVQRMRS